MSDVSDDQLMGSPLLSDVKDSETMDSFLKNTNMVDDEMLGELSHDGEEEIESEPLNNETDSIEEDFEQDTSVEDDPNLEYIDPEIVKDESSFKLGTAAIQALDFLLKEIFGNKVKIPEKKFFDLESSKKFHEDLRKVFREFEGVGLYQTVKNHNKAQKERLGLSPEEFKKCAHLLNQILTRHGVNVELGPEGELLMLFFEIGYRNYNVLDEIKKENQILSEKLSAYTDLIVNTWNANHAQKEEQSPSSKDE